MLYPLVVSLSGPKTITATVPKARIDETILNMRKFHKPIKS